MKILALTDIHGAYKKTEEIISGELADVVVLGGDLTTAGSVKEAEGAVRRFQSITERLLCVAGNMDMPQLDDLFVKLGVSINNRGIEINGVGFCGVSASPFTPLHTPYELSEEEIWNRLYTGYSQINQCAVRVIVPHAPPYGTKLDIVHAGFHVGSTAVRDFVENEEPEVVICGHIHEARGQDVIGRTKIVNCGPAGHGCYAIIKIDEKIEISNHQKF